MTEKFDEFLNEVENDIRQEKLLTLWRRYGKAVTAAIIGVVVTVTGYSLWQYYDYNVRLKLSEKLNAAQELIASGNTEKALSILEDLTTKDSETYGHLAAFQKAGLLLKDGTSAQKAEAVDIFRRLAKNTKLDSLWRDLSTLLEIIACMDQPDYKNGDLISRLDMLVKEDNPWRHLAREMKGVLLYKNGQLLPAAETFARLVQDNQTASGISVRARLMTQIVSAELPE
jgi:hypothetical protein